MGWKAKRMLLWSLVTAAAIAAFWAVWRSITGSVPVVSAFRITDAWAIPLPVPVSRWWDVLAGPLWTWIIALAFAKPSSRYSHFEQTVYPFTWLGLIPGAYLGLALAFGDQLRASVAATLMLCVLGGVLLGIAVKKTNTPTEASLAFLGAIVGTGIGVGTAATAGGGIVAGIATSFLAMFLVGGLSVITLVAASVPNVVSRMNVRTWTRVRTPRRSIAAWLARKEIAELRNELSQRKRRIEELERTNRATDTQHRELGERKRQLEAQCDQLRNLAAWCAAQQGVSVEQLQQHYTQVLREE